MPPAFRAGLTATALVVLLALTACGPESRSVIGYRVLADTSGLEPDRSDAPTVVFRRSGAPTLAAYNRFIVDPVQVNYSDPDMKELDPEQVAEMQAYLQNALIEELRDGGYEVGTRSQPGTMRISLTISGLMGSDLGGAANVAAQGVGAVVGVPVVFAISVGEVTVEGVFREAMSNRIDAVVVDRARGSRLLNDSPWSTWADVRGAFDNWAEGIRKGVDEAHGR